jgi:hypothetical protein
MTTMINTREERAIADAVTYLFSVCDGAQDRDNIGWNGGDAGSRFIRDMRGRTVFTPGQLRAIYKILKKYEKTQLVPNGYELPTQEEIGSLIKAKEATKIKPLSFIDVHDEYIFVVGPYEKTMALKEKFIQCRDSSPSLYCGKHPVYSLPRWSKENKEWCYPCTAKTALLIRHFLPDAGMSESAVAKYAELDERIAALAKSKRDEELARDHHYQSLLSMLGSLDAEFAPGKTMYPHQKECVEILLRRPRFIVGDKPGLGKTYETILTVKAYIELRKTQGKRTHCYVMTTKSAQKMWRNVGAEVGVQLESMTWESMKIGSNEQPSVEFIAIFDEAHKGKNINSARTKAMLSLAWHPNCIGCYLLTGTPFKNARPIDFMTLLMAIRHPLVYSEFTPSYPINFKIPRGKNGEEMTGCVLPKAIKDKMFEYKKLYCDFHSETFGSKTIWVDTGSSNLEELNAITQYDPRRSENHPQACLISRMKNECPGMPRVTRIKIEASLSYDEVKAYSKTLDALWKEVERRVPINLAKWIERQTKEENETPAGIPPTPKAIAKHEEMVKNAEALVAMTVLKRAAAVAKVNTTIEELTPVVEAGDKAVIFTHFKESLGLLREKIENDLKVKVGVIDGSASDKYRNEIMEDFQSPDGKLKVVISTSAGSEAITLTAANYMIIVDRPWTTGDVEQEEGRIDRSRGKKSSDEEVNVTIVWPQMPADVSEIDLKVDGDLSGKLEKVDKMQFGEKKSHALDFALDIIDEMKHNSYKTVHEAVLMAREAVVKYRQEEK